MKDKGILAVLKCDRSWSTGSIFTPLAEWEDDNWRNIDNDNRKDKYINNGCVFHNTCYPLNALILADIHKDIDNFDEKDLSKSLFQIKKEHKPFCKILAQKITLNNPPPKISLEHYNYCNGEKVCFNTDKNFIVGPYQIEFKENKYVACASLEEEIFLNRYLLTEEVKKLMYFFADKPYSYLLLTDEIKAEPIVADNSALFKRILNLSKKVSRKEKPKIIDYIGQHDELSQLIEKAFPLCNVETTVERIYKILNNIELNSQMIEGITTFLIETPKVKEDIEKYKMEGLSKFISGEKEKINQALAEVNRELEQKKCEHDKILKKIEKEKKNKESLIELNEKMRQELSDYIQKGEKWRNALYPNSNYDSSFIKNKIPAIPERVWDGQVDPIDNYLTFSQLLGDNLTDDGIRIKQCIKQLAENRIFQIDGLEDLKNMENFFDASGHKRSRFILEADCSWLTPNFCWGKKGHFSGANKPTTLLELIKIAAENKKNIFLVEILGANRAPIEGYFGSLIKAIERKEKLIVKDIVVDIPDNIFFFLQLDHDEYTAKLSKWLAGKLKPITIPPPIEISKKISIPAEVFLRGMKEGYERRV